MKIIETSELNFGEFEDILWKFWLMIKKMLKKF